MDIALLGFGTVGQGIYQLLDRNRAAYERQLGQAIRIKKILVRDLGKKRDPLCDGLPLTDSFEEILRDDSIAAVFEVTSDGERGLAYNRLLLERGKQVISANKAAIASGFFQLQEAARLTGSHFRFEAAVAGGIPLIDPLSKIRQLNVISRASGILNATTNYILTELSKGRPEEEVRVEARTLGVLEEDPTDDLEGYDARRKIAILAAMILGRTMDEKAIPTVGISRLSGEDFAWAREGGRKLKLIASLIQEGPSYALSVLPTALGRDNSLAWTDGLLNQLQLEGDVVGHLAFSGLGGGMYPTAHALWSDFFDVWRSAPLFYAEKDRPREDLSRAREAVFYLRDPKRDKGSEVRLTVGEALDFHDRNQVVIEKA